MSGKGHVPFFKLIKMKILKNIGIFFKRRTVKLRIKKLERSYSELCWYLGVEKQDCPKMQNIYDEVLKELSQQRTNLEKLTYE